MAMLRSVRLHLEWRGLSLLLFVLIGPAWSAAVGTAPLLLHESRQGQSLQGHVWHLLDADGQLTMQQVLTPAVAARFQHLPDSARFGVDPRVHWYRFSLQSTGTADRAWWLQIANPWLDDIRLYMPDGQGQWRELRSGDHIPPRLQALSFRHFTLPLQVTGSQPTTFYLRVQTVGTHNVPLSVWQPERLATAMQLDSGLQAFYYGVMLVLVLYNLFLLFSFREWLFAEYALTALFGGFSILAVSGQGVQLIWGESAWAADRMVLLIPALWSLFGVRYMQRVLDLVEYAPRLNRAAWAVQAYAFSAVILTPWIYHPLAIFLTNSTTLLAVLISLFASLCMALRRYLPAWFMVVGYALLLTGALGVVVANLGVGGSNIWAHQAMQLGTMLEGLLLAFALALRNRMNQQEGERAIQQVFLAQASELKSLQSSETVLEARVQSKTRELDKTLRKLERESQERSRLEALLRENEALVKQIAYYDVLTGLPNRLLLADRLERLLAGLLQRPEALGLQLLLLDVDGFRQVNGLYGQPCGDAILQQLAQRLQALERKDLLLARLGGDEFAVVVPELLEPDEGEKLGRTLLRTLAVPYEVQEGSIRLTVTIGMASAPQNGHTMVDLLQHAELALHQAKQWGGNHLGTLPHTMQDAPVL
ncbi:diguanylate cyclase domain-containing protein [Leeia sp.]|uniref:diguanylate cyclase domain-containing protein n=1 Tax=Leeia sp. TaxID=2884678 RepID=UPI0035B1A75F